MGGKIGIVTLGGSFNYGNRLQNYAVSELYRFLGFQPETLLYDGKSPVSFCRHVAADLLRPRATARPEEVMSSERKRRFASFTSRIPTFHIGKNLDGLSLEYDFFSVGSDQVWNPNYLDSYKWMFLQFAEREQRIALSPSIGFSSLRSPYARTMITRGLRGFDHLSVREVEGAKLIKSLTGQNAAVLVDPTLLLSSETWRRVANDELTPNHNYIFSYVLGDKTDDQVAYVNTLEALNNASTIYLSDRSKSGEVDAGPSEFISLIDNAQHVVTDSFHAAVFSLLLGTPLTVFRRSGGSGPDLFSRLSTLLGTFGLEDRVFGDEQFGGPEYEPVSLEQGESLALERQRVLEHLRKSTALSLGRSIGCGV